MKFFLAFALFLSVVLGSIVAHADSRNVSITFPDNVYCVANDSGHAACMAFDTNRPLSFRVVGRHAHSSRNHSTASKRSNRHNRASMRLTRRECAFLSGSALDGLMGVL